MQEQPLIQFIEQQLDDYKATDIKVLDVTSLTDVADHMVVATATSKRHASGMADKLVQAVKANNVRPLSVSGEKDSEWILIDLGDVIVHLMLASAREFYSLEKLWSVSEAMRQNEH